MVKKIVRKTVAIVALASTAMFAQEASQQFEKAWQNPNYTQIELEDVDVNKVLNTYYTTSEPVHFTREMLWDVERKKAWEPKTYISHVVSDGESWGRVSLDEGVEQFTRWTQQRQWLTGEYAQVIEGVTLLNKEQKAIFIGLSDTKDANGKELHTNNPQTLFHVVHGVAGSEDQPINTLRFVHLTSQKDTNLIERSEAAKDPTTLPKYIEVYIEKDLGISLKKK